MVHIRKAKWVYILISIIILQTTPAWAEMYVEGYLGGVQPADAPISSDSKSSTSTTTAAAMRTTAAATTSGIQLRSRVSVEGIGWESMLTTGFYTRYERNTPTFGVLNQ